MNARFLCRTVILLAVGGAGFALGILAHDQPAFSQDRDAASNVVPLTRTEFDTPEAPIRNALYAVVHRDNALYYASFGRPSLENIDFSEIEFVFPVSAISGVAFESRKELAEDRFEIRATPVGDGWNQRLPDVYTVEKQATGWIISDLRSYGPDEGGLGRYDAAWPHRPNVDPLVGVWVNEDPDTSSVTRVEISIENNEYIVRMWGSCTPSDCYWGTARASSSAEEPSDLSLTYVKTFANMHVSLTLDQDGLICTHLSVFKDDSGRTGHEIVESFKRL